MDMAKAHKQVRIVWDKYDIPSPKGHILKWKEIPWREVERKVFKLQKRIYQATQRGDVKTVRTLQKMVVKSWYAKLLAVRRVTQDNQGKKTAGVDGFKSLSPEQRLSLARRLHLSNKAKPVRRVWLDKPGKKEKRPLGIPTMYDRAMQALLKVALEPEWEAKFEPNSYGFRPGRSCHDAINAIYNSIHLKPKYVLDADIAGCFDNIDQKALLTKLNTSPSFTRQIRAWLKAGVIDWSDYSAQRGYSATSRGTPQGGVISPLLANVALHGMEERLKQYAQTLTLYSPGGFKLSKSRRRDSVSVIRYADDFVVLHEDIAVIQRCREILSDCLKGIGLELKPSKTHVSHTLVPYEDNVGFDFLGFRIKQFKAGKYNTGNNTHGVPLGFKTIITPSPDKISSHYKAIVKTINAHKSTSQEALITKLNPQIRGWANYYQTVNSTDTFKKLDALVWNKLWAWAKRRHPTKGKKYIARKYWQTICGDNWVFVGRGIKLNKHSQTKIKDYTMVKGEASPYNGNLVYWSTRRGYSPEMPARVAKLLKEQQGKCAYCGHHFREDDLMEVHRIVPGKKGGKYKKDNMRLLHRHCHDKEHGNDGKDSITSLDLLE